MIKRLKYFLVFFLLVLAFVAAPPIGFLIALSWGKANRLKSKFAVRARLRTMRAKQNGDAFDRLHSWFRRALWPQVRASKRVIWEYYCRPKTILFVLVCTLTISLAICLLISHVNTEKTSDYLSYGLWQITITGFLAISIAALAWVLFSIEFAFRSVFVTLVLSAIVSGCIICARLFAIEFFSKIFPFPPTYAPVAFGIATTLLLAPLTSIVFACLALLFELYFLAILGSNLKKNKLITALHIGGSALGLFGAWFATYAMFEASNPKGQLLIVELAKNYDFTSNHMCDAGSDEFVLFIDNVADRAIAAKFPDVGTVTPKDLSKDGIGKYMPTSFHTVRCNPIDPPANQTGWCNKPSRRGYCRG